MARLKFSVDRSGIGQLFDNRRNVLARAATKAVTEIGQAAQDKGRANIAAAGFSQRWQNALRLDVYPKGGNSINAAAYLHHNISYSSVFERPTVVQGKPLLWMPLDSATERFPAGFNVSGRASKRLTPQSVARAGIELKTIKRLGKPPLLAGKFAKPGKRSRTVYEWVPLFVGVPLANMTTSFDIEGAAREAAKGLPAAFSKYLKDELPDG